VFDHNDSRKGFLLFRQVQGTMTSVLGMMNPNLINGRSLHKGSPIFVQGEETKKRVQWKFSIKEGSLRTPQAAASSTTEPKVSDNNL